MSYGTLYQISPELAPRIASERACVAGGVKVVDRRRCCGTVWILGGGVICANDVDIVCGGNNDSSSSVRILALHEA